MDSESGAWIAPERRERSGARLLVTLPWPIPKGKVNDSTRIQEIKCAEVKARTKCGAIGTRLALSY